MSDPLAALREEIARAGFRFVPAARVRALLEARGSLADWRELASSWNDMPLDTHLPDGHRYRRRRHATLAAGPGATSFTVEPHQPHYQALEYNSLVGGIERWFEPIPATVLGGESFRSIVGLCLALFGPMAPAARWHIECHQFRIEARPDAAGLPTPEGVHRDGVDYVLVMLVSRVNIASGTTTMHAHDGTHLDRFTLTEPLDSALVDDNRVKHGVTPVEPLDPARVAYRDVLVVTLRAGK